MKFKNIREIRIYFKRYLSLRIDIDAVDADVLYIINNIAPITKIKGGYIIDTEVYDKLLLDNPNTKF